MATKVYIIRGFTNSAYYNEWENFGVYADRNDAEKEMIRLAVRAFDEADLYNGYYPDGDRNNPCGFCKRECLYQDGELVCIHDDREIGGAAEVYLTIDEMEIH